MIHQVGDKVLVEATVAAIDDPSNVIKILTPMPDGTSHWAYVDSNKVGSINQFVERLAADWDASREMHEQVVSMTCGSRDHEKCNWRSCDCMCHVLNRGVVS